MSYPTAFPANSSNLPRAVIITLGTENGAVVKAPSCLKVRLARFVLRRVLMEKSLGDTKDSLEGNDFEVTKGNEAIKTFGLETKSSLGLDYC